MDSSSINRINDVYLKHIAAFSNLLDPETSEKIRSLPNIREEKEDDIEESTQIDLKSDLKLLLKGKNLSELSDFINNKKKLNIPVYTIYGIAEDSIIVNKFRNGNLKIKNLYLIDETNTETIITSNGLKINLFGLGGTWLLHKLFDHGKKINNQDDDDLDNNINKLKTTKKKQSTPTLSAAGNPGNMWITALQIGQLIKTVESTYSDDHIRIFITHPSPAREGLLSQLAVFLRADYTISNGLHFIYPSSYNEFSINPNFDRYKLKLSDSRNQFAGIWRTVKPQVISLVENEPELKQLLSLALDAIDKTPTLNLNTIEPISLSTTSSSSTNNIQKVNHQPQQLDNHYIAFQNLWHFNLGDVQSTVLLLNIVNGKFKIELHSEGFDFNFRKEHVPRQAITTTETSSIPSSSYNKVTTTTTTTTTTANKSNPTTTPATPAITNSPPTNYAEAAKNSISGNGGHSNPGAYKPPRRSIATDSTSTSPINNSNNTDNTFEKTRERTHELSHQTIHKKSSRPGVWISNANNLTGIDESKYEQIKHYFREIDRKNIVEIEIKSTIPLVGSPRKFALVYFNTDENALEALKYVDLAKAEKATILEDRVRNPSKNNSSNGNTNNLNSNGSIGVRGGRGSGRSYSSRGNKSYRGNLKRN